MSSSELPVDPEKQKELLRMWITDYPDHNEFEFQPEWAKYSVVKELDDGKYMKYSLRFEWPKQGVECWIKSDKHYNLVSMV